MPPLSTGTRRILFPAAAAIALGAFSAGIADADDTPDAPTFTEPFPFENPGAELSTTEHGAANGAAPGAAEMDTSQIAAPSRPVVLIPAEVGSTLIPAAPEPGKSLLSSTIPAQGVSVTNPIGGMAPSRTLVLTPERPRLHQAVPVTAIDKAAVDYSAHPVATVGDADIVAGLNAAGVASELTPRFTAATRTIIGGESGGSTNAVNRWDSNAWGAIQLDGAPHNSSRGPMQTVPGTFAAHHAAGTSTAIYDPVANIAAAWRYIRAEYGVNLSTGAGLDTFMARGTGRGVGY